MRNVLAQVTQRDKTLVAAAARTRYSLTVLCEMRQLRATARLDRPHVHFNRNTSLIFRMDNLSCDIATSPLGIDDRDSLPHFVGIIQRYFAPY